MPMWSFYLGQVAERGKRLAYGESTYLMIVLPFGLGNPYHVESEKALKQTGQGRSP